MQASINNTAIAESDNTVEIEGNPYFPPEDVQADKLQESDTPYTCPWKGDTQYFDVVIGGETYEDAAWSYPEPKESAVDKVGDDFGGYIAFDESQINVNQ